MFCHSLFVLCLLCYETLLLLESTAGRKATYRAVQGCGNIMEGIVDACPNMPLYGPCYLSSDQRRVLPALTLASGDEL